MDLLTPQQAAQIASGVYALRTISIAKMRENQQTLGCEGLFSVDENSRFEGYSGAMAWKKLSGFGYIADGEGPFNGDVLVATRGTQGGKLGPDWVSNYNIGMQAGPSSLPVHAGFHEIWKTFSQGLGDFLASRQPRRVHCVGHSLGGALATLTADLVTTTHKREVALYTFGAPRVGDPVFARSLTARVRAERIFRVYHPSDPVPMIPLFPFFHMPFGGSGLQVSNQLGGLINADAHAMEDSYLAAVGQASWADLQRCARQRADEEASQVKSWLERAADGRGGFVMGSARLLSMIGKALRYLVAQAGKLMVCGVQANLLVSFTVVDQLAWLLSQAAHLSLEIGRSVLVLIGAIFAFLGRKTIQLANVTAAFLRWLLALLFTSLRSTAERALALVR